MKLGYLWVISPWYSHEYPLKSAFWMVKSPWSTCLIASHPNVLCFCHTVLFNTYHTLHFDWFHFAFECFKAILILKFAGKVPDGLYGQLLQIPILTTFCGKSPASLLVPGQAISWCWLMLESHRKLHSRPLGNPRYPHGRSNPGGVQLAFLVATTMGLLRSWDITWV